MADLNESERAGTFENNAEYIKSIGVFEEYIGTLMNYNPAWLADPPSWCSDISLSNETVLNNTKAWAEGRGGMGARVDGMGESVVSAGSQITQAEMNIPIRISNGEVFGRHLIAARDIKAGEAILLEPPLLLSLRAKSAPYCSTCFKRAQNFSCPECGFFFCNSECLNKDHNLECGILKGLNLAQKNGHQNDVIARLANMTEEDRVQAETLLKQSQSASEHQRRMEILRHYIILATVKTLVSMKDPLTKRLILSLQGHIDSTFPRFRVNQKKIVEVVKNLGVQADPDLVHRICSVWDTNSFDVPLGWGTRVQGLYPLASLLTHNCRANTQQWFTADGYLVLRTVQDIQAGSTLTTCYTDPQWATLLRQDHLRISKQFTCTCERCTDPTELGTFLGSPLCGGCGAPLVSPRPLDSTAVWVCHGGCPITATAKEVAGLGAKIGRSIGSADGQDSTALTSLATQLQSHLHPTHHVLIRLHVSTLNTIINADLCQMNDDELETVWSIASLVSGVIKRLEAPLTRLSVRVAREAVRLQLERIRRGKILAEEAKQIIKNLATEVRECELVLGWDQRMPDFNGVIQDYNNLTDLINTNA